MDGGRCARRVHLRTWVGNLRFLTQENAATDQELVELTRSKQQWLLSKQPALFRDPQLRLAAPPRELRREHLAGHLYELNGGNQKQEAQESLLRPSSIRTICGGRRLL